MTRQPPATVLQNGRPKAYRPLPTAERRAALSAGIAAYERGDFFEAHELLEPAWMGTADPVERDLHQGLIKLAAAFVHDVRGNPVGMMKNLTGARARLAAAHDAGPPDTGSPASDVRLDLGRLVDAIDARLAILAADPSAAIDPPRLERSAP
jgi:predicted metal-dependent hydrolase